MPENLYTVPQDIKFLLLQTISCSNNGLKGLLQLGNLTQEFQSIYRAFEETLLLSALEATIGANGKRYILPVLLLASAPKRSKQLNLKELKELAHRLRLDAKSAGKDAIKKAFLIVRDIDTLCTFAIYGSVRNSFINHRVRNYENNYRNSDKGRYDKTFWLKAAFHLAIQSVFSSALYTKTGLKPTDRRFTNSLFFPFKELQAGTIPNRVLRHSASFDMRCAGYKFRKREARWRVCSWKRILYQEYCEDVLNEIWVGLRSEAGLPAKNNNDYEDHFYDPDYDPWDRVPGDSYASIINKVEKMYTRSADWRHNVEVLRHSEQMQQFVRGGMMPGPWLNVEPWMRLNVDNKALARLRWEWLCRNRVEVEWELRRLFREPGDWVTGVELYEDHDDSSEDSEEDGPGFSLAGF